MKEAGNIPGSDRNLPEDMHNCLKGAGNVPEGGENILMDAGSVLKTAGNVPKDRKRSERCRKYSVRWKYSERRQEYSASLEMGHISDNDAL